MDRLKEEERSLRDRYRRREERAAEAPYSVFQPAYLLALQQRDRLLIRLLRDAGVRSLASLRILDAGCGSGQEMLRLVQWGATPENLTGIDLFSKRCEAARRLHPSFSVVEGNLASLPFADGAFDLVMQFTTFSSILDEGVRIRAASEISRVMVPNGLLIWYDFWLNPMNRDTRGIGPRIVRRLFPGYSGSLRRVTLAPPVARAVAPRSAIGARLLGGLWPLQTHYLGVLRKPANSSI